MRIIAQAMTRRVTLIAPLIRTPLWKPIDPLNNLFKRRGWITAPTTRKTLEGEQNFEYLSAYPWRHQMKLDPMLKAVFS